MIKRNEKIEQKFDSDFQDSVNNKHINREHNYSGFGSVDYGENIDDNFSPINAPSVQQMSADDYYAEYNNPGTVHDQVSGFFEHLELFNSAKKYMIEQQNKGVQSVGDFELVDYENEDVDIPEEEIIYSEILSELGLSRDQMNTIILEITKQNNNFFKFIRQNIDGSILFFKDASGHFFSIPISKVLNLINSLNFGSY